MLQYCLGVVSQQFDSHVQNGPHAGRAIFQRTGIPPCVLDQLPERLKPRILADADKKWVEGYGRYPGEILDHLVLQTLGNSTVRRVSAWNDQQRIAIGIAARNCVGGKAS